MRRDLDLPRVPLPADTGNVTVRCSCTLHVRLYQMLLRDPGAQVCYYEPGVGTFASPGALLPVTMRVTRVLGLAIGLGLVTNVEDGYQFLMQHWRPGDRVYLFGFSRGAYTARAIAAIIHRCGLLEPGHVRKSRAFLDDGGRRLVARGYGGGKSAEQFRLDER